MKKKILYVIALILLCSAGCSNAQEKDHPNKETVKDKVTVTNQTKEDKTTQQEKEETKNEDNDDTKKEEQPSSTKQQSSSNTKKSSPKTEVPQVNQPSKENTKDTSKPTNKPSNPPKQDVKNTPVKQSAMEVEVLNKINNYRADNGLQPLSSSQYYQEKANAHAYAMAEKRALWHEDNGECITNSPDPFTAWINSSEHKNIVLTPNNTVGVVAIYYVDGYYYSVFRTYW